jgi:hypothetical protein
MRADDLDAGYQAVVGASIVQSDAIDVLILDGIASKEGVRGNRFHAKINNTNTPGELDGVIFPVFNLKPGFSSEGVPQSVAIDANSAPVFTSYAAA